MSNIHKPNTVKHHVMPRTIGNPLRYHTIQIPVIDIPGDTAEKKRQKVLEAIDDLLSEFSTGPLNQNEALYKMFDVVQVMVGYLLCHARESVVAGPVAHRYVEDVIQSANDLHLFKIRNDAQERGWELIRHEPT